MSKPDNPPALPKHVSNDGREIWDWASRLGDRSARQHKESMLRADIRRLSRKECGHCNDWMKSRVCPREWNDRGMCRGPSCSDAACSQFSRKSYVSDLIAEKQDELSAMLAQREESSS